jgi:hypothetical protein
MPENYLRCVAPICINIPADPAERSKIMTKRSIAFGIALIIVCGLVIWTAFGRPPIGPFNNMGFGSDWDCPPNATPAATVCV